MNLVEEKREWEHTYGMEKIRIAISDFSARAQLLGFFHFTSIGIKIISCFKRKKNQSFWSNQELFHLLDVPVFVDRKVSRE